MSGCGKGAQTPSREDVLAAARACLAPGQSAWLVGGCVRDELLGRPARDVDLVVAEGAEPLARALADRLGGAVYASSDAFGTWRVIAGEAHVDIAPLRGAASGRDCSTTALAADLRARDVTVDAMARPLTGGELVDPLGGATDLQEGRLRLCSPTALADDPLRIVRIARLAAALGMAPDGATVAACLAAAPRLVGVSSERVRDELCAVLALPTAPEAIRRLAEWEALVWVLPEVDALRGVEQNPYHHLDVFGHTLEAVGYVRAVVEQMGGARCLTPPDEAGLPGVDRVVPVAWAVLLHDIGKPQCRAESADGRVIFWGHDEVGSRLAVAVAARLRMSARFSACLATLVREHLRLGFLVGAEPLTRRALARYRRDVSPWVFESVVLSLCDRLATRGDKTSLVSIARHYRVARRVWTLVGKAPIPKLLNGEEVMELLAIGPGPDVGLALEALEEEIDAGEVTTPDEARSFLQAWWLVRREAEGAADASRPGREPDA